MKRRRQGIRVDTFPFLAVLLCAMGSLILLLLVIDRRAKIAARAKAVEEARELFNQKERLAAVDKEAWEKKCKELHDILANQDLELKAQLAKILGRKDDITRRLEDENTQIQKWKQAVAKQRADLDQQRYYISQRRGTLARATQKEKASQQELTRLAQDLDQLDRTLQSLLALKHREQQTYSLIPYRGKRGDNRKPIYVECSSRGLVFHPGQRLVVIPSLNSFVMRAEVERVGGPLPADPKASAKGAYVLFLVRPDGISSYYAAQEALKGLPVDYGYEFIDTDMVFDFSGGQNVEPQSPPMSAPLIASGPTGPLYLSPGKSGTGSGIGRGPGSGQGAYNATGQGSGLQTGSGIPGTGQAGNGYGGSPSNGVGAGQSPHGTGGLGFSSGTQGPGLPGAGNQAVPGFPGGSFIGQGPGLPWGTGSGQPGSGYDSPFGSSGGTGQGPRGPGGLGLSPGAPGPGLRGYSGDGTGGGGSPFPGTGAPGGGGGTIGRGNGNTLGSPLYAQGPAQPGSGPVGVPSGMGTPGSGFSGVGTGPGGPGAVGIIQGSGAGLGWPVMAHDPGDGNGPPANGNAGQGGTAGPNSGTSSAGFGPGNGGGIPGRPGVQGGVAGSRNSGNGNGNGGNGNGSNGNGGNGMPSPPGAVAGTVGPPGFGGPGAPTGSYVSMAPPSPTPPGGSADTVPWRPSAQPTNGMSGNTGGLPAAGGQNFVPGSTQPGPATGSYPRGQVPGGSDARGDPLADPDAEAQQRPRVQLYGGGGGGSGSSGPPLPTLATSLTAMQPQEKRRPTAPPSLARRFGNRDFVIVLECTADAVFVQPWGTRFPVAALPDKAGPDVPLVRAVQQRIAQRQAAVRPGEPDYRPLIRFKVHPEGLRAYYKAYPLFVPLGIPMMRESLEDAPERGR